MLLKITGPAALVLAFILPTRLLAGGPPWLCMPLEGVAAENASTCSELLTSTLKDKRCTVPGWDRSVLVQEYKGQWYAAFFVGENVSLKDVETALKGSEFSVPRKKLRLFGYAILEIEGAGKPQELLTGLEALSHVSVAESATADGRLLVTVDMPYPDDTRERERPYVGWDSFQRGDFSSDQSTRSEAPATARTLPSFDELRKVIEKHGASLKDVRWSAQYACRPLGCVVEPVKGSE